VTQKTAGSMLKAKLLSVKHEFEGFTWMQDILEHWLKPLASVKQYRKFTDYTWMQHQERINKPKNNYSFPPMDQQLLLEDMAIMIGTETHVLLELREFILANPYSVHVPMSKTWGMFPCSSYTPMVYYMSKFQMTGSATTGQKPGHDK